MAHPSRALVVDDDEALRTLTADVLSSDGWVVEEEALGAPVPARVKHGSFDLVVLDQKLPDADGVQVLQHLRADGYAGPAIVMTGYPTLQNAVAALGSAASGYLCKPVRPAELLDLARRTRESHPNTCDWQFLWTTLAKRHGFSNVLSADAAARQCYITGARVAASMASVLIEGETGTGKEYLARAIHYMSPRRDGPFVALNCGAIPDSLLESELFGHEKGAFTSATSAKPGICELADGGTLLLDEVGELSPTAQVKLLRFLQDRSVTRLGGLKPIDVDVRVIAATNRDLLAAVEEGRFREDLYYRLAVVPLYLPPLRERPCDIPLYSRHFLEAARREAQRPAMDFDTAALEALASYSWPGNLRELHNVVYRAALLAPGTTVRTEHLQMRRRSQPTATCMAAA